MQQLRSKMLSAAAWSAFSSVSRQVVQFTLSVVLARLLTPQDFGLIGMILVFTGFAQLLSDLGLGPALIQKIETDSLLLSTVFWINISAGICLTIVFAAFSPLFATLYHQPQLQSVSFVISTIFLISSLNVVQNALLQKKLDFKNLAKVEITATLISGILAIALAVSGAGVWSLVWQTIAYASVSAAIMWLITDWKPLYAFSWKKLNTLMGFGTNLMGFNIFNYLVRNMDNFLVGKYLGTAPLGIYARAYGLMLLPLAQVSTMVSRVAFPAMASIQGDIPRLRNLFLSANRIIGLVAFPIMAGLFAVADHFIIVVYGEKWIAVTPVLRILCITGILQPIGTTVGCIYTSLGRTDIMMKWGLFSGIIYILSFIIGLHWGIIGVAASYTIAGYCILQYPAWRIPGRLINLTFREMFLNITPPLLCSFVMVLCLWGLGLAMHRVVSPLASLVIEIAMGAIVYISLLNLFHVAAYKEFKNLFFELLKKKNIAVLYDPDYS
jgi:PST family polysaccharide transporter